MNEMNRSASITKEKVHFYVPDFYSNAGLYCMLADFIEHIPQWFFDDFKISAAYGSFPNCIWNGGRQSPVFHGKAGIQTPHEGDHSERDLSRQTLVGVLCPGEAKWLPCFAPCFLPR